MSDCNYLDLKVKQSPINSMGTENYVRADFENRVKQMTLDQEPLNLMVDPKKSYTSANKDLLLPT